MHYYNNFFHCLKHHIYYLMFHMHKYHTDATVCLDYASLVYTALHSVSIVCLLPTSFIVEIMHVNDKDLKR